MKARKKFNILDLMDIFSYSTKTTDEILSKSGADLKNGLDAQTVARRRKKYGKNNIALKETAGWHIFFRQFKSAFVYLLIAAIAITFFLGEWVDALMILIFLAINGGLGFYQEFSSEKTAQLLNKFALPRAKVLRNGKTEQITADALVPGDIVILETGNRVPADLRLIETDNMIIDETILTGESAPVHKNSTTLKTKPASYGQAANLAFSGTDILKGEARGIVIATGEDTAFGQIAKLAGETIKESDFEKGIRRFSQFILKLVGITLLAVFSAHLLISRDGIDIFELVIFLVALTVSVIPEALPLVTTFSLSRGAKRLAKKKVIVKRLSAIEDLGSMEILCSDKTGTLTENRLAIADVYSQNRDQTIWMANLASSFELESRIEPFDIALEKGLSIEQKNKIKAAVKISENTFDPESRLNSAAVSVDGKIFLIKRGSSEAIIASCARLAKTEKENINEWIIRQGKQGRRVLAVACREFETGGKKNFDYDRRLSRRDFIFAGVISFVDPIKKSSFATVKQAEKLGVKIIIITGDSPEVAGAVACEIGLIETPGKVITEEQWRRANAEKRRYFLENYRVFARVTPEGKFAIIEALRGAHTIGFLGEGINDAAALKIAGVSMAVNSASDIAREASDIILLEKNLNVVIEGIREGRRIFANTAKYIKSTLASNFGNFFAVAIASLIVDFLPMLPIQILLVNLLSDAPMISISTDTVQENELKAPKKYQTNEIIIISMILGMVSTVFDFIFFSSFYRVSPEILRTNWFIGSILTELALLFSIRTTTNFLKAKRPSPPIIALSAATLILTVGLPYTAFGQEVFRFVAPAPAHLGWIFLLVFAYFAVSEAVKLLYYRNRAKA